MTSIITTISNTGKIKNWSPNIVDK